MDDEDTVFLYAIKRDSGEDEALVPWKFNNQLLVSFKIDTGAQANVIPKNIFNKLDPKPDLLPTNQWLTSYCRVQIPVIGTCDLPCSHKQHTKGSHKFYVVDMVVVDINSEQTSIVDDYA